MENGKKSLKLGPVGDHGTQWTPSPATSLTLPARGAQIGKVCDRVDREEVDNEI